MTPQDLDQKDYRRLMQVRGGCTCWCHSPCHSCTAPLTEDEMREVSILSRNEAKASNLK